MKLAALALHGSAAWPGAGVDQLDAGLNVLHGPPASGKTAIADLVTHALCGRRLLAMASEVEPVHAAEGELIVESGGHRYRLRRVRDEANAERLTIAALDGTPVDRNTVHGLVYGLPPTLLGPMFSVNFREPLRPESLIAGNFAQEFRSTFCQPAGAENGSSEARAVHARIRALEWELTTLIAALGYRRRRRVVSGRVRRGGGANRASSFLARLTGGEWTEVRTLRERPFACVVHRTGRVATLAALTAAERDQVHLSVCMALVTACAERGVQLPLVLDEPFVRLDRRQSERLVTVLDEFGRRGHQVLVFTARQEAVERFRELHATTHDILALKTPASAATFTVVAEAKPQPDSTEQPGRRRTRVVRKRRRAG